MFLLIFLVLLVKFSGHPAILSFVVAVFFLVVVVVVVVCLFCFLVVAKLTK